MKKKIISAILVLCTQLCFSQTKPLTQKEAVDVIENLTHLKPIKCIVREFDGKETIFCLSDKRGSQNEVFTNPDIVFYKLSSFANTWRIETQQPIFKEENQYCHFLSDLEVNVVDGKPYLYLVYALADEGTMAGNTETLKFSLFSLNNYKLFSLNYTGDASYDDKTGNFKFIKDGSFSNLDSLKTEPTILSFLEEKIKQSTFIYRSTSKDLDINTPDNNEKKWLLDNPGVIDQLHSPKKTIVIDEPLKITYYDKNLFANNAGSIISKVENHSYKFVSYFKGSVVGFNKLKRKYFPIWAENCNEGCNKEISLISPNILKINYTDGDQTIMINLNKMTYTLSYLATSVQNPPPSNQSVKNYGRRYLAFNDELLIRRSQTVIQNSLKKEPKWHFMGSQMNDFNLLVLHYTCVYKPEKLYPFQVSFYYWIDPDTKNSVRCFVEFPSVYLRYMISRLKGYVQVDDTHFQSTDGNISVSINRDGSQYAVEFFRND
ncbi:hypothetical protein [Mucilaginibacter sp.]|uniref:hypothetical protein n=1 Tax=Mucilaginibacter sp. TaxID=1882438 RepID=UPI00374D42D1